MHEPRWRVVGELNDGVGNPAPHRVTVVIAIIILSTIFYAFYPDAVFALYAVVSISCAIYVTGSIPNSIRNRDVAA